MKPVPTTGFPTAAWIRVVGVSAVVIALEAMCRTGIISHLTVIPPSEMVWALIRMLSDSQIDRDVTFTLENAASAIVLSTVGGFIVGAGIHALPRLRTALEPIFSAYYAVPTFVFYPLFIVAFGIGAPALIAMGTVFGIVAMIINTLIGLDRVPRAYLKTARIMQLDAIREVFLIRLPAALPHLVTGIKLSVSYSVIGIIAGEFILSTAGVGKRIAIAYNEFDNATMYGMLLFILVGVASLNGLLHHWECSLHTGVASVLDKPVKPRRGDYVWLALGFIVLWQGLYYLVGEDALATPVQTIRRTFQFLDSASFWPNVASTGVAFAYALLISLAVGLVLGIWLGFHRFAGDVADPILSSFYSIPKITLYPVILLLFGLGLPAKIAFGAIHGLFPMAIFTMNGVRNVATVYHKTAAVLGLSRWMTAKTILVPAALPEIVAGLRLGAANTLLGILIGELFASTSGIGFILIRATESHKVVDIMSLALLIFIAAASLNGLLLLFEKRVRHAT